MSETVVKIGVSEMGSCMEGKQSMSGRSGGGGQGGGVN